MKKQDLSILRPENMFERVFAETGLDDFGDPRLPQDYERLFDEIAAEVEFSPQGIAVCEEHFHRMLVNRLRMERDFKEHPEIEQEVLAPPLIVTGFARSGTTKLQQMISAAPGVQALSLWRMLNPAPFPDAKPDELDPRITFALQAERVLREHYPEMWAAHPTPAMNAEEDMLVNDMTFIAPSLPMRIGATQYTMALSPADPRMYEYTRRVLKYLQWQDGSPDRAARPWVLKCPIHLGNLVTIQKVHPGAKVVHCHRDVEVSMASTAALSNIAWRMYTDHVDKLKIGDLTLKYWSREWEFNLQQRRLVPADTVMDVRFEDINRDGMQVIERIFEFAGLELEPRDRAAMIAWEKENTRHKHGVHEYTSEEYGFTRARVNEAFRVYHDYFAGTPFATATP
jgi:hypothetical protein